MCSHPTNPFEVFCLCKTRCKARDTLGNLECNMKSEMWGFFSGDDPVL